MDFKLEVVVVPVTDVGRAKDFYKRMGFREDIDFDDGKGFRVVQLTPPGSSCSIIFGNGVTNAKPGSIDRLVLAVADIDAARGELESNGVRVGGTFHDAGGGLGAGFVADTASQPRGADPQRRSYASYATLSDPDGNVWMLQELTARLPGRV